MNDSNGKKLWGFITRLSQGGFKKAAAPVLAPPSHSLHVQPSAPPPISSEQHAANVAVLRQMLDEPFYDPLKTKKSSGTTGTDSTGDVGMVLEILPGGVGSNTNSDADIRAEETRRRKMEEEVDRAVEQQRAEIIAASHGHVHRDLLQAGHTDPLPSADRQVEQDRGMEPGL